MNKEADRLHERTTLFAELLLPVPIPRYFTYRVPSILTGRTKPGLRAIVQFGDRRILTGIIVRIHDQPPSGYEVKSLLDLLDEEPVIHPVQQRLFQWIANYYLCSEGEVLQAALPSGLRLSSESMVQLNPAFNPDTTLFEFTDREHTLLTHLEKGAQRYSALTSALGVKSIYTILRSLITKEAVILFEEVKDKYVPKTEKRVRLAEAHANEKGLETLFELLAGKPKQEAVLLEFLQTVSVLGDATANEKGMAKSEFTKESVSPLKTLLRKNVFEEFEVVIPRFSVAEGEADLPLLNTAQQEALESILSSYEQKSIAVLHGITGSGKTEVYIHLIKKALESGSEVLYLLPEIALTTQIVKRLQKVFGPQMGVYHSRFSDNERVETWKGVLDGRFKFIAGVRSSVFLPFENLGLIIVDEEHDASYKQQDPAPRYHARDVALILSQMHHARVLLGSATPAAETMAQANDGKYGYVRLDQRYGEAQLPGITLANMQAERKNKTARDDFSRTLLTALEETLKNNEQAIIFQNRRGFSPIVNCQDCSWIPKCVNCAVSLTYHQYRHAMVCHYCGYKETLPSRCPSCGSTRLLTPGYGTERLVEELRLHLPDANIQRMDLETTRTRSSYETLLNNFANRSIDILVGTQMITKGLDFDHVSLVGIFNADKMMHFPDFRSYERAYQLITQVSGRAGRREKKGNVVIQTSDPQHPLLGFVVNGQQETFYQYLLADRKQNGYPPFTRLIQVTVRNKDKQICRKAAEQMTAVFRERLTGLKVLGPGEPMVARIKNQYLMNTMIKIPRNTANLDEIKSSVRELIASLESNKDLRQTRFVIDVDPV